jgi:plasmid stabilization system protein ParE
MVKEIIWSPNAIETFEDIVNYLNENFGERSARIFVEKVDAKLKLIQVHPTMFRRSTERKNTFITVIRPKTTLTYRFRKSVNKVELIVFWGMQNPKSKPK